MAPSPLRTFTDSSALDKGSGIGPLSLPIGRTAVHVSFLKLRPIDLGGLMAEILSYLPDGDLAAVAISSRRFNYEATRLLWRELPSPNPVLKLLPGVVITNGHVVFHSSTFDWTRFDLHARWIHRFHSFSSSERLSMAELDDTAFASLYHLRPGYEAPLFPQLRSVSLLSLRGVRSIKRLTSTNLNEVRICIPPFGNNFLLQLHAIAPHLNCIQLSGQIRTITLQDLPLFNEMKKLIIAFPQRIMTEDDTSPVTSFARTCLPFSLSTLSINTPSQVLLADLSLSSLPLLNALEVAGRLGSIMEVLRTASGLEKVVINVTDDLLTASSVALCFVCLTEKSSQTLRSIRFTCNYLQHFAQAIAPLLDASTITSFSVEYRSCSPFDLDDVQLLNIVRAWPHLVRIVLPTTAASPSALTPRCLGALSRLRHLREMQLAIGDETAQIPVDPFRREHGIVIHKLKELFSPEQLRL